MQKVSAVLSCIFTVLIAVVGISVYASGNGYMTWFGFEMSPGVFGGLIAGLAIYDWYAIRKAFGAKKQTEEAEDAAKQRVATRNNEVAPLSAPCTVTLTRLSSSFGCAMGIQVFMNGYPIGTIKNGQTLSAATNVRYNELSVHYNADNTANSIVFEAAAGGFIGIELKYVGAKLTIVNQQFPQQAVQQPAYPQQQYPQQAVQQMPQQQIPQQYAQPQDPTQQPPMN